VIDGFSKFHLFPVSPRSSLISSAWGRVRRSQNEGSSWLISECWRGLLYVTQEMMGCSSCPAELHTPHSFPSGGGSLLSSFLCSALQPHPTAQVLLDSWRVGLRSWSSPRSHLLWQWPHFSGFLSLLLLLGRGALLYTFFKLSQLPFFGGRSELHSSGQGSVPANSSSGLSTSPWNQVWHLR
jgi:hypothetical protein